MWYHRVLVVDSSECCTTWWVYWESLDGKLKVNCTNIVRDWDGRSFSKVLVLQAGGSELDSSEDSF